MKHKMLSLALVSVVLSTKGAMAQKSTKPNTLKGPQTTLVLKNSTTLSSGTLQALSQNETHNFKIDPRFKIDFKNASQFNFQKSTGGVDGSGGGSVLLCTHANGSKSYQLYDYEEGSRPKRALTVDLGPASLSVENKLEIALTRLARVNPTRAGEYREMINAFWDNTEKLENKKFGNSPDVKDEIIPENCERQQVIFQRDLQLPEDKRFSVNMPIWNQLDNTTKAGLILHEVVYYEQGLKDVRTVRYFNSWLASEKLEKLTPKQYVDLLNLTFSFTKFDIGYDLICSTHNTHFKADGTFLSADSCQTIHSNQLNLPSVRATTKSFYKDGNRELKLGLSIDSWMLGNQISNLDVSAYAKKYSDYSFDVLPKDGKIQLGQDIELIPLQQSKVHIDPYIFKYRGNVEYDRTKYKQSTQPYLFKLDGYETNWSIKTAAVEVNLDELDALKCRSYQYIYGGRTSTDSEMPLQGYLITAITEDYIEVGKICQASYKKSEFRTQRIPR